MLKTAAQILNIFETLHKVDKKSPDLDFGIKFKNKGNFKILKENFTDIQESLQEIYEKYGKQETRNGVVLYNFKYTDEEGKEVNNMEIANSEIKKIHDAEIELALIPVKIQFQKDQNTGKTDTFGLNISAQEMDVLEDIFVFEYSE